MGFQTYLKGLPVLDKEDVKNVDFGLDAPRKCRTFIQKMTNKGRGSQDWKPLPF